MKEVTATVKRRRNDGSEFMEKVYQPSEKSGERGAEVDKLLQECLPNVTQEKNGELVVETNSPKT